MQSLSLSALTKRAGRGGGGGATTKVIKGVYLLQVALIPDMELCEGKTPSFWRCKSRSFAEYRVGYWSLGFIVTVGRSIS